MQPVQPAQLVRVAIASDTLTHSFHCASEGPWGGVKLFNEKGGVASTYAELGWA